MPTDHDSRGFIEIYDLTKNKVASTFPLAHLKFLPRKGERVLVSPSGLGDWESYSIVNVAYFLGYDPATKTPETPSQAGKITLYVEPSEKE
jgi:hypothetical protein